MQTTEYELRDRIDQLADYRGEGTELVTVAVPPDKSLRTIRERISREHTQAENIKSDKTRTNVQDALGRIRRHLQAYEETPPKGLVVYAGVVDGELRDDVFDDLDRPVDVSIYRCAAEFETAPVEQALTPSTVYGLVVLERGRAALGRLAGERIVDTRTIESQVMDSNYREPGNGEVPRGWPERPAVRTRARTPETRVLHAGRRRRRRYVPQ
ncbi:hypothetical protein OB920_18550 [Halobacteria archaeon HArc-gm2]|nr:hypothetical protein [Halobacteria archaeon HArc-gm2]